MGAITSPPPFPFDGVGRCDDCQRPTTGDASPNPKTDGMYVGTLASGPTGVLCGECCDKAIAEGRSP